MASSNGKRPESAMPNVLLALVLSVTACSSSAPASHELCGNPESAPVPDPTAEPAGGSSEAAVTQALAESPRLSVEWTVSDEFSPDEAEAIIAAGEAWSTVTDGRARPTFVVGPVPDPSVVWTISRGPVPGKEDTALGKTLTTVDGSRIRLDADVFVGATCAGQFWQVAAHEIGHSLGIVAHGANGIMSSGAWPTCAAIFTRSDILLFEQANP